MRADSNNLMNVEFQVREGDTIKGAFTKLEYGQWKSSSTHPFNILIF